MKYPTTQSHTCSSTEDTWIVLNTGIDELGKPALEVGDPLKVRADQLNCLGSVGHATLQDLELTDLDLVTLPP